ncbi:MAG: hypothetical protein JNJ86_08410 [Chitinophagaceae bacterium]|jgi:hypothetical protein|nr:hypothetical protein [Chitinophagaceae bacterium]
MKQAIRWIGFFVLCAVVIAFAVHAGMTDHHCYECLKGVDEKAYENSKFAYKCIYNN